MLNSQQIEELIKEGKNPLDYIQANISSDLLKVDWVDSNLVPFEEYCESDLSSADAIRDCSTNMTSQILTISNIINDYYNDIIPTIDQTTIHSISSVFYTNHKKLLDLFRKLEKEANDYIRNDLYVKNSGNQTIQTVITEYDNNMEKSFINQSNNINLNTTKHTEGRIFVGSTK